MFTSKNEKVERGTHSMAHGSIIAETPFPPPPPPHQQTNVHQSLRRCQKYKDCCHRNFETPLSRRASCLLEWWKGGGGGISKYTPPLLRSIKIKHHRRHARLGKVTIKSSTRYGWRHSLKESWCEFRKINSRKVKWWWYLTWLWFINMIYICSDTELCF